MDENKLSNFCCFVSENMFLELFEISYLDRVDEKKLGNFCCCVSEDICLELIEISDNCGFIFLLFIR